MWIDRLFDPAHRLDSFLAVHHPQQLLLDGVSSDAVLRQRSAAKSQNLTPEFQHRQLSRFDISGRPRDDVRMQIAVGDVSPHSGIEPSALEFLLVFRWPGNIRQLANEMKRVAALAEAGAVVGAEHLSREISGFSASRKTEIARREARENESCACFEAVYGPASPAVTVPATETTLTRCDGAAASSAGRKARRHHTPPR